MTAVSFRNPKKNTHPAHSVEKALLSITLLVLREEANRMLVNFYYSKKISLFCLYEVYL